MCFGQDKEHEKCSELLQKTEKKSEQQQKNMLLEKGLLLKMQIHSLPAGGAFGAAETEVSPVTAVNKAALPALMNTTLPDQIKSKPF